MNQKCDVKRQPAIVLRRFDNPGAAAVFGDKLRFAKGLGFLNFGAFHSATARIEVFPGRLCANHHA
jgi:hypothetical protein